MSQINFLHLLIAINYTFLDDFHFSGLIICCKVNTIYYRNVFLFCTMVSLLNDDNVCCLSDERIESDEINFSLFCNTHINMADAKQHSRMFEAK